MTFGEISANTMSKKATAAVATVITLSLLPNAVIAITVTSAVAKALISVLAINTNDSTLSVRSKSHNVVAARLLPRLDK